MALQIRKFALECYFSIIFAWFVILSAGQNDDEYAVVRTKSGPIRGLILKLQDNLKAAAFLGIPYAEPPVGPLRFKDPVPKVPWNETLNATKFGPICIQSKSREHCDIDNLPDGGKVFRFFHLEDYLQEEDCLSMNIYVPEEALPERMSGLKPLPVMFFIHGGSYKTSGGRFYPGERLASQGKVIVVTVNYRLGALGFLSTDDSSARGNYGLLDQILALRWIQDNVDSFGGNSSDVTIFGSSAGAACVGLHLISPKSKGLFTKAIVQSGSPIGEWAVQRKPRKYTERLVLKLNCTDTADSEALLECLRNVSAELITEKSDDYTLEDSLMLQFAPVVDGEFLLAHPNVMLQQEGSLGTVPVLVGVTRNEFEDWMALALDTSSIPFTKDLLRKYLFHLLRKDYVSDVAADVLLHAVYTEYVYKHGTTSSHHNKRRQQQEMNKGTAPYIENPASALPDIRTLAKIISDIDLKAPTVKFVKLLALHSSVTAYMYEFDYVSKDDILVTDEKGVKKPWVGSYHGSELYYIFGYPHMNISNSLRLDEDKEVADIMIQLWSDFAKTGNPTPKGATQLPPLQNFSWSAYTEEDDCFAILGLQPFVARSYESERMAFWNHFIPLFTEYPITTLLSPRGKNLTYSHIECITRENPFLFVILISLSSMLLMKIICYCVCRRVKFSDMRNFPIPV